MNIKSILIEGITILKKNKIPNPELDSEILLSNSIKKDKKYIIQGLSGTLIFGELGIYNSKSNDECKNKKKIIMDSISSVFPSADVQSYDDVNADDGYGQKALRSETYYRLDLGEVWIQCVTWGKKTKKKENLYDSLRFTLITPEFMRFMNSL